MNNKLKIILVIIISLSIVFTWIFFNQVNDKYERENSKYFIEYSIDIKSNDSYVVYAPIVYTDRHSADEIFSRFEVDYGNVKIEKIKILSTDLKFDNLTIYPSNDRFPEGNRECYRYNDVGIKIMGSEDSKIGFKLMGDTYYSGLTFADFNHIGRLVFYDNLNSKNNMEIHFEMKVRAYNRVMDYEKEKNTFTIYDGWNNVDLSGIGLLH